MTKRNKTGILYKLHFLKSLGFEFCEDINLSVNLDNTLTLPNVLSELKSIVDNCHLCSLSKTRKHILFGEGSEKSNLFFLYDEPNSYEDMYGEYYSGKNSNLLAKMIESVLGFKKEEVYLSSLVKCKSSNANISRDDVSSCNAYLHKQLSIIKPKVLIILGNNTYDLLFSDGKNLEDVRGKVLKYNGIDTICTYHPSFLLRNPSLKKEAYHDMLKIKTLMETF